MKEKILMLRKISEKPMKKKKCLRFSSLIKSTKQPVNLESFKKVNIKIKRKNINKIIMPANILTIGG